MNRVFPITVKRLSLILATVLLLTNLSLIAFAASNNEVKKVRVAVEDSDIFFTKDSDGDIISGYGYEYIQTIAAYANWDVEYLIGGSFNDCLENVIDGKADVYYDVSYTEERAKQLLYPETPMGSEEYYLFCLAENNTIHADDLSSFNGKKVGITFGTIEKEELTQWCNKTGIQFEFVEYESDPAKDVALEAKEIDFEYEVSMVAKNNFSAVSKVSESDYYLVTNKNRPDLLKDINAALNKIYDVNRYFVEHLNEKYFAKSVLNRTLSTDEANWINNHEVLNVGYMDDYLPFSDINQDGSVNGIVKDIVPVMLENLGIDKNIQIDYLGYPDSKSLYTALKKDEIDIAFPVYQNTEFGVNNKILISSDVVSLSADIAYCSGYSENTVAKIAVNKSNQLQEYFTKANYPDAEIIYFNTIEECLQAVLDGRAGSTILNGLRTSALLSNDSYKELYSLRLTQPFSFGFAVNQGNAPLLSLINRSLANLDEGFAFNYAFDYMGSESDDSLANFIRTHKVLLLMMAIILLIILTIATFLVALSLSKGKRKLKEAYSAKTSFLFNMSHDIRTPMNAIIGFNNIALKNIDNREIVKDSLVKTKQASEILLNLINSVLEMSRIEAGKIELNETPSDIRYSFSNIDTTMSELANSKNIELTFSFGEISNYYVYADFDCTARIFINLISNAVKYTQSGGRIQVKCEQIGKNDENALIQYTFEDNGIGMSDEFQKHIYDEFAREKNTTSSGIQGSGLGLSVVKSLVEIMHGTIEVNSKQGEGTKFIVTLPFRIQAETNEAQFYNPETHRNEYVNESAEQKPTFDFAGKKVLLVEDNMMNREIAEFILTDEQLIVEETDDGINAVRLLKEKGPDYYDFILMDIQMPIMNGYDATKAIREMYPNAKLPIIALSANAFEEDKAKSLSVGMNAHIAKPINTAELFDILKKYL